MRNRNKKNNAQSLNVRGKNNATNKGGKSLTPSEAYGLTVAESLAAIMAANGDTCTVRKMKTIVYVSERDGQSIWLLRKYAAVIKGEQKGLWNGDKHRYEIPRAAWDHAEKAKTEKPTKPQSSSNKDESRIVAIEKRVSKLEDGVSALIEQNKQIFELLKPTGTQNAVGRGRGRRSLSGVAK